MIDKRLRDNIILITYAAIMVVLFINVNNILNLLNKIVTVMMPLIYGFVLAYIINWPYTYFINRLHFHKTKYKRLLALILSYLLVIGIIIFLIVIIVPQVITSISSIVDLGTIYYPKIQDWLNEVPYNDQVKQLISNMVNKWDTYFANAFSSVYNFTRDFTISMYNWIIGFIISVYMLSSKEKLVNILKRVSSAYLPKYFDNLIKEISLLLHDVFGLFIKGKILDSFIVGIICFVGMTILRMPYTVLISVIIGFTNLIPFFGPFFGAIPSIIIMLVISPIKAIWLTIFILIIQQVDGNIIGPKILGESIGISGIFIIFSVLLGGGLFGVPGMILGVPVFAVVYTLIGRIIRKKERSNLII